MNFIKKNIPLSIIIVFHLVGFVGFLINPAFFRSLSPLNLLLSTALVLLMSNQSKWQFYVAFLGTGILGYFIEVLGVKTGVIFGSYFYGQALGYKILSVPIMIGVNWAILLYCTSQIVSFKNNMVNGLLGALLMTGLDFFIEQSAAKFDFWYWKNSHIPLQNYIAWFVVAFGLNLLFQKHLGQKPNSLAKAFYVVQLLFFIALYIFI